MADITPLFPSLRVSCNKYSQVCYHHILQQNLGEIEKKRSNHLRNRHHRAILYLQF